MVLLMLIMTMDGGLTTLQVALVPAPITVELSPKPE